MKIHNASEWAIALVVVVCSAVLFATLAFALSGTFIGLPAKLVDADFVDITGVSLHSKVKYSGASAGRVAKIRMLSAEERLASRNPRYAVRVTLALSAGVPPLTEGALVSIAADTILADKFIQIESGDPAAPLLADGEVLPSVAPVTFDQLVRNADAAMVAVNSILGGASGQAGPLFAELRGLLEEARLVLEEVRPAVAGLHGVIGETNAVLGEAHGLLSETREPVLETIQRLDAAVAAMESAARTGESLLSRNEKNIEAALAELRATSQNAKVATTFLKFLSLRLAQNPSTLIWGRTAPPPLPSEKEILTSPRPLPLDTR